MVNSIPTRRTQHWKRQMEVSFSHVRRERNAVGDLLDNVGYEERQSKILCEGRNYRANYANFI